ncbi:DUF4129 domain-containing protein [Halosolutus halophilus]|uniref:DUF4129 domain-containing protein n=1 Tax=Halosolutus halophilus TaxID=1552990 RepID=UPI002234FCA4|nr:DUF4129 domain-containing protein [Halosolutus halophilus]
MAADSRGDESSGDRFDYRQVSFVVLAALALVLAAFFSPGFAGDGATPPEPEGDADPDTEIDPDPGSGSGDGTDDPGISFDWTELLDWLDLDPGDGGETTIDPDGDRVTDTCTVALDRDPVPGREVTAMISYRGQPLADVPVRFNDRSIGETDERGRVTGEVPYAEQLIVHVGAEGDPSCRAVGPAVSSSGAAATFPDAAVSSTDAADETTTSGTALSGSARTAAQSDESNSTVEYEVDGDVEITVADDPYPGDPIEIRAVIEDEPMRGATVTVDGDQVTETAADGTATITVPDDGSERIDVRVERGDFAGAATVDVLLLEAALLPGGLAPVPGSDGYVAAEIDGEPVPDAAVTIDGEERGRTGADGMLAVELPRDPTATVTVGTTDQTATVTLLEAYGGVALLLSIAVAGIGAVTYRTHGVRGPIAVAGLVAGLVVVLVVEAFYGPVAGLAALGAAAAIGLGAVAVRDGSPGVEPPAVRDATRGVTAWVVARALALVGYLETLIDRLRGDAGTVRAWVASLPRSVPALRARVAGWLRSLSRRGIAAIGRVAGWLREHPTGALVIVVAAVPLLFGGYVVGGARGVLVAAAILAVAVVAVVRLRSTGEDEPSTTGTESADAVSTSAVDATGDEAQPSFRELWRAFARQVAPGEWQTRTPGEIERAAYEAGYPREPVRELTTLFREVEYGERPLSDRIRERAAEAVEALTRDTTTTDGGRADDRSGSNEEPNPDRAPETDSRTSSDRGPGTESKTDPDRSSSRTGGDRP